MATWFNPDDLPQLNVSEEDYRILRTGGVSDQMASFLSSECKSWDIIRSVEIGCAAGYGSLTILRSGSPEHYGLDISKQFYRDKRFRTGELALDLPNYKLLIGLPGDIVPPLPTFNLVYIDADHRHPAPTIDLWNLVVTEKIIYPFKLLLDDTYFAIRTRKSGFKSRGALVLMHALESQFDSYYSPPMNQAGINLPNQCVFLIDNKEKLINCLTKSFTIPFEFTPNSNQIL